jgi:hypothetical protein
MGSVQHWNSIIAYHTDQAKQHQANRTHIFILIRLKSKAKTVSVRSFICTNYQLTLFHKNQIEMVSFLKANYIEFVHARENSLSSIHWWNLLVL